MTFVVNPHSKQEEKQLLAFLIAWNMTILKNMNPQFYLKDNRRKYWSVIGYEAGEMKSYSLDEIIAHFNISEK